MVRLRAEYIGHAEDMDEGLQEKGEAKSIQSELSEARANHKATPAAITRSVPQWGLERHRLLTTPYTPLVDIQNENMLCGTIEIRFLSITNTSSYCKRQKQLDCFQRGRRCLLISLGTCIDLCSEFLSSRRC